MNNKPKVIVISGPTASGKTSLAMKIADIEKVELINMDSTQTYIDMNIGTAKPSAEELKIYPHHLINIRLPTQTYSASDFFDDMLKLVPEIIARGNTPLLVGGTMMYLNILQKGLADLPEANEAIRAELNNEINQHGFTKLHEELKRIDPDVYQQIQGDDTKRLIRFIEIHRVTGRKPSELFSEQVNQSPFDIKHIAITPEDRAELHTNINNRFVQMAKNGLIDELEHLREKYELHPELASMRSVGYRQAWSFLEKEYDYDSFIEKGQTATRQLAKRQLTWLRKLPNNQSITKPDFFTVKDLEQILIPTDST